MAKIELENVTLSYPVYGGHGLSLRNHIVRAATGGLIEKSARTAHIVALKNINLKLQDGDSVGVIGHNGAGKSTLLRTMAGIYTPSEGKITLEGKMSTVLELGAGLDYELSGYENIINLGMMMGYSYSEAKSLIPDIEDFTELGDFLGLPIRTYSSGMTMRLMFAVATAATPEILILDEMFSTGDAAFREKSRLRIEDMIKKSKIFIFASHDLDLIKKFCNRVFLLEHGVLTEK